METEVFDRNNSINNESSNGNSSKRMTMGAAAAAVGAVGGAAVAYGASKYMGGKEESEESHVITPNPDNVVKPEEQVPEEPVAEEKSAAAQPAVTHVTNNHYHTHYETVAPEPEPDPVSEVHVFHHEEPAPQFMNDLEHIHIHEDIVHHIHEPEPDIHITKNVDIVHNHIHMPEPPIANPVDIIANDVLAQGEFVDPMALGTQHLDMASVDTIQTIDGQQLTAASFTSPSGDDMYLVNVPEPEMLTVPDVIEPIGSSVADDDTARFLAHGAVDIIADNIGGDAGDIIHDVNDLISLA